MQAFDCNFDPPPAEMLLFTAEKRRILSIYHGVGITLDIPNEQPSQD